ncbi:HypC/HybG/HupF family hydrogenase formation chaperone [Demequina sp. NBRC 110054]|uniref:HypC/HybG/HupF family hydrogenase formation chaperone n=1 Tax=Demequina sp. NBRC 110054 TaxID=1570343 RepID=UPI00135664CA|nr:HypC/HybG/HupF family hydrogenase formation chaperone [Demequina sp. NBRC 110054]
MRAGGAVVVEAEGRAFDAANLTPGEVPLHSGDWVIVHSGFVLGTLSEAEALDALAIRAAEPAPPRGRPHAVPALDPREARS